MLLWNKVADSSATTCKAVNVSEDIINLLGPEKMQEPNIILCQSPEHIADISG